MYVQRCGVCVGGGASGATYAVAMLLFAPYLSYLPGMQKVFSSAGLHALV